MKKIVVCAQDYSKRADDHPRHLGRHRHGLKYRGYIVLVGGGC